MMNLERQSATAGHWTEEQYRHAFQREGVGRLVLVAEGPLPIASGLKTSPDASSDPLGFLVARHLAPDWELENIVVAATARRIGLGKRLLDAIFAVARETNSHSVFLEVRESNMAARALYEKTGFEPTARRKAYYTDPVEDAILYCKTLN